MNSLGTISTYSAYTSPLSSAYDTKPVSKIAETQETSAAAKSSFIDDDINDEAIISDEAKALLAKEQSAQKNTTDTKDPTETKETSEKTTQAAKGTQELTPEQQQIIQELKQIDAEVKAHEHAHLAAAAGISASPASYTYQTGPDGNKYAVGGEVSISFSHSSDPEENIANARTMRAAALAPAEPSSQDMAVAQQAAQIIADAQQQLKAQEDEERAKESAEKEAKEPDNIVGVKKDATDSIGAPKTEEPALTYGNKKADSVNDTNMTEKTFGPQKKDETTIAYGSTEINTTDNINDKSVIQLKNI